MTRALTIVVLILTVALTAYVAGCTKKPPPEPPVGPIEPPVEPVDIMPDVTGEYTYVCRDHPEQTADEPGTCPICGAFMEADTDEAVEYYCPDHPEVVQDTPGEHEGTPLVARPTSEVGGEEPEPTESDEPDVGEPEPAEEPATGGEPTEI